MTKNQKGFTLVELMIVVAIIGVLAAVAIPKFADMLEKSREGATKGNLSAIKSAIANYYADQQGTNPGTLDTNSYSIIAAEKFPAFIPQYIDQLPGVKATGKFPANGPNAQGPGKVPAYSALVFAGGLATAPAVNSTGTGYGWRYDKADGAFWVNSTMLDMSGKAYTMYGYE